MQSGGINMYSEPSLSGKTKVRVFSKFCKKTKGGWLRFGQKLDFQFLGSTGWNMFPKANQMPSSGIKIYFEPSLSGKTQVLNHFEIMKKKEEKKNHTDWLKIS